MQQQAGELWRDAAGFVRGHATASEQQRAVDDRIVVFERDRIHDIAVERRIANRVVAMVSTIANASTLLSFSEPYLEARRLRGLRVLRLFLLSCDGPRPKSLASVQPSHAPPGIRGRLAR